MPEHIGDQFEACASAVCPSCPGVTQDIAAAGFDPAMGKSAPNQPAHKLGR
jgi:hypothetical protein